MGNTDTNNAIRIRKQYRGDNLYIILNLDDSGNISSIDLSQTTGVENVQTTSGLEFVAQLVNNLLQFVPPEVIAEIAASSSLGSRTLPGIIHDVFKRGEK